MTRFRLDPGPFDAPPAAALAAPMGHSRGPAATASALCLALATLSCAGLAGCRTPPPIETLEDDTNGPRDGGAAKLGQGELQPAPAQLERGIPHVRFKVSLDEAPTRGPDDAPITLVMFSDFECPFCGKAIELVHELEREYDGKIRFVYKAFPIDRHPYAMLAALIGHSAVAQGKFWAFHDLLYSGRRLDESVILGYVAQAKLDADQIEAELARLEYGPELRHDLRQAKRLDVRSTPTFFINGRPLVGAQPKAAFEAVIDEELSLAKAWRKEGIAAADIYDYATELGYTHVEYEGDQGLDEDSVYPVPLAKSPQRGPTDAKLTVVVFSDFRCPYCTRGNATLEQLRADYAGEIRVVYKYLPFQGPLARSAALAAWAAGQQGKFWEFHDLMYARGPRFEEADLELMAMRLELDMERWYQDLENPKAKADIKKDSELAQALGVSGTPTYFINGRPLDGARSDFDFRLLFSEELERAQAKLDAGVAPEQLYSELSGLE